jgi:predicted dehydrogenase
MRRVRDAGIALQNVRFTRRYADLLESADVDIVSISTPNHLHAEQAVAAARAGKHILLEKPTGLDLTELRRIRDAVRRAKVRTIVSFELHYNPYLRFARWLRESGRLGSLRFARFQYLSRVTDWYSGWNWARTERSGRSHLLAAGCHAVDAMRWCTGLEAAEVSAYHTRFTSGYEYPTSIVANLKLGKSARSPVIGQIVSSTDFQMPYAFGVEMMGDRATLRDDLILWNETPVELDELRRACPLRDVRFHAARIPTGADAIRIEAEMPGSADVRHHPFQGEIDELVDCILENRESHLNVHDAQKTMEICIAADKSAERGAKPVRLPLLSH